jgi:hypothetical protein
MKWLAGFDSQQKRDRIFLFATFYDILVPIQTTGAGTEKILLKLNV